MKKALVILGLIFMIFNNWAYTPEDGGKQLQELGSTHLSGETLRDMEIIKNSIYRVDTRIDSLNLNSCTAIAINDHELLTARHCWISYVKLKKIEVGPDLDNNTLT